MVKRKKTTSLAALEREMLPRHGGNPADLIRSIELAADSMSQVEKHALLAGLEKKFHKGVDLGYIRAVLFPEVYSYDIPQPLSNLSYSRFTDKQDAIISTQGTAGALATPAQGGCGLIVWYPKVTVGPSLFLYRTSDSSQLPSQANPIPLGVDSYLATTSTDPVGYKYWRCGFSKNYTPKFTQTALVAASLSIQYIGQVDQESGIMVGGHIYGQTIDTLSLDDIENSQFVTRARPSEGLRFTYLPMEGTDYEYYPTAEGVSHNNGAQPTADEQKFYLKATAAQADQGARDLDGKLLSTNTALAKSPSIQYANNSQYIAIYWKGLEPQRDWLRIDVTRKFNGVPKQEIRDIVEVSRSSKNFNTKKTFDVLRTLCLNAPVGGHTLKDLDKTQDRIQAALPNIASDGMIERLDEVQSLSELAGILETPVAMEKGLIGQGGPVDAPGRLYPFNTA